MITFLLTRKLVAFGLIGFMAIAPSISDFVSEVLPDHEAEDLTVADYKEKLLKKKSKSIKLPEIRHVQGVEPSWNFDLKLRQDYIEIDFPSNFKSKCIYNLVLQHELAHTVEHTKRIGYKSVTSKDSVRTRMKGEIVANYVVILNNQNSPCLDWVIRLVNFQLKSYNFTDFEIRKMNERAFKILRYMNKHYTPIFESFIDGWK